MALTRSADLSSAKDPLWQLARIVGDLLPRRGLALMDPGRRWSDRLLTIGALLMFWCTGVCLGDRFLAARACLVELYDARKRPGKGYNGFFTCLTRHHARLRAILVDALRKQLIKGSGDNFRHFGFAIFGADGTKVQVPRTDANIAHFGVANKKHAGPEILLCGLFHLTTRSLWSFAQDIAKGSERALLATMLKDLPENSLVVADAGFVGWNTFEALKDAGHSFIIRAGANVRLITQLGCYMERHGDMVWLWPDREQKKNVLPIVLRRVLVIDGRGRQMCLLTDVTDERRLSDERIIQIYKMRWGVEIAFRWLKGLLQGRKMLSNSPIHASVELDWTVLSLWVTTTIALVHGVSGEELSVAGTLRIVRDAMTCRRTPGQAPLAERLSAARRDRYTRNGPKSKRHYPKRSRVHKCRLPWARTAKPEEISRYQAILERNA